MTFALVSVPILPLLMMLAIAIAGAPSGTYTDTLSGAVGTSSGGVLGWQATNIVESIATSKIALNREINFFMINSFRGGHICPVVEMILSHCTPHANGDLRTTRFERK